MGKGSFMKPVRFEYVRPASMDEALAVLGRHPEAVILAGGQSLLPMLNMRLVAPSHVVDISRLKGLDEISIAGGWLRLRSLPDRMGTGKSTRLFHRP